jgi:hypothetical protein
MRRMVTSRHDKRGRLLISSYAHVSLSLVHFLCSHYIQKSHQPWIFAAFVLAAPDKAVIKSSDVFRNNDPAQVNRSRELLFAFFHYCKTLWHCLHAEEVTLPLSGLHLVLRFTTKLLGLMQNDRPKIVGKYGWNIDDSPQFANCIDFDPLLGTYLVKTKANCKELVMWIASTLNRVMSLPLRALTIDAGLAAPAGAGLAEFSTTSSTTETLLGANEVTVGVRPSDVPAEAWQHLLLWAGRLMGTFFALKFDGLEGPEKPVTDKLIVLLERYAVTYSKLKDDDLRVADPKTACVGMFGLAEVSHRGARQNGTSTKVVLFICLLVLVCICSCFGSLAILTLSI